MGLTGDQGSIVKITGPLGAIAKVTGENGIIFQVSGVGNVNGTAAYSPVTTGTVIGGVSQGLTVGTYVYTPLTAPLTQATIDQTGVAAVTETFTGAVRGDFRTCNLVTSPSGNGIAGRCSNPDNAIGTTASVLITGLTRTVSIPPTVANGGIVTRTIANPNFVVAGPMAVITGTTLGSRLGVQLTDESVAGDAPIATAVWSIIFGAGSITQTGLLTSADSDVVTVQLLVTDTAGETGIATLGVTLQDPPFEFANTGFGGGQVSIQTTTGNVLFPASFLSSLSDAEGNLFTYTVTRTSQASYGSIAPGGQALPRAVSFTLEGEVPPGFINQGSTRQVSGIVTVIQQALPTPVSATSGALTGSANFPVGIVRTATIQVASIAPTTGQWQIVENSARISVNPSSGTGNGSFVITYNGSQPTSSELGNGIVVALRPSGSSNNLDTTTVTFDF